MPLYPKCLGCPINLFFYVTYLGFSFILLHVSCKILFYVFFYYSMKKQYQEDHMDCSFTKLDEILGHHLICICCTFFPPTLCCFYLFLSSQNPHSYVICLSYPSTPMLQFTRNAGRIHALRPRSSIPKCDTLNIH